MSLLANLTSGLIVCSVVLSVIHCQNHCRITNPTATVVSRVNEETIIECQALDTTLPPDPSDPYTFTAVIFDDEHHSHYVDTDEYSFRGITWNCYLDNCTIKFNLSSAGNVSLHCVSEFFDCQTDVAHVYIVDVEKVPRPAAPVVQLVESGTLNVSWSPPWEYPVNDYSLRVALANGTLLNVTTTTNTSSIITRPDGLDCQVLQFSVLASTDIGQSDYSNITIGNFLQRSINKTFHAIENVETFKCSELLTYKINGKLKNTCSYEVFSYAYTLTTIDDKNRTLFSITPNTSVPTTFFQLGAQVDKRVIVSVTVTNLLLNQSTSMHEIIDLSDTMRSNFFDVTHDIQHPATTVALADTIAVFYCSMYGNDIGSNNDMSVIINGSTNYSDLNINVTKQSNREYEISILAQPSINQTEIQCFISPCFSKTATLIVVEEYPAPVGVPVASVADNSTVNISWSPLWPHPVNQYVLVVEHLNHPRETERFITNDTYYVLQKSDGFECEQLSIAVEALTDIGNISAINNLNISFFKGLASIDPSLPSSYIYKETYIPTLQVSFQPPEVCDNEVLVYQFILQNYETDFSRSLTSYTNSSVAFELDSISLLQHTTLTFNITVNISDGIEYRLAPLFTNLTIHTSGVATNPKSVQESALKYIVASVCCTIILLLLASALVVVVSLLKKMRVRKQWATLMS